MNYTSKQRKTISLFLSDQLEVLRKDKRIGNIWFTEDDLPYLEKIIIGLSNQPYEGRLTEEG
tara:strand:+ start:241 stop:426 length:186 start_codon:yes stop_codon:yes gene_type:complete